MRIPLGNVWSVAFSPDGGTLAFGGNARPAGAPLLSDFSNGCVWFTEVETDRVKRILDLQNRPVGAVAFSPAERMAAIGAGVWAGKLVGGEVMLCDPETRGSPWKLGEHAGWISSVVFSQDGSWLASGSQDRTVKLWNPHNGNPVRTLSGHRLPVRGVAFAPSGDVLASVAGDERSPQAGGELKLWRVKTGALVRSIADTHALFAVAFSPEGSILATGDNNYDAVAVKLRDVNSGSVKRTLTGHQSPVLSLAFAPNGKILGSGSNINVVKLWDVATGEERFQITASQDRAHIQSMAFSPDGRWLALGGETTGARLWGWDSGP